MRPYPYHQEDRYENKTGGVRLAGTLTLPRTKGPDPAVVLITGSGKQESGMKRCWGINLSWYCQTISPVRDRCFACR